MKKIFSLLILLSILLCAVSCSLESKEEASDKVSETAQITEDADSENDQSVPPPTLRFSSFEEVTELKSMLDKDEKTIGEYLQSKSFDMNGLRTKSDIDKWFKNLGDIEMLHLDPASGYKLVYFSYSFDKGLPVSIYSNGKEKVRLVCYMDNSDHVDHITEEDLKANKTAGEISIASEKAVLYQPEESKVYRMLSCVKTANSQIFVHFSNDEADTIKEAVEEHFVFTTLNELIEIKN